MTAAAVAGLLSPAQHRSVTDSTARVNLWAGAVRSGKTIASLLAWLAYVADAPRGGNLVMVGRTRESIARNVFQPLQDTSLFGPLAGLVSYTAGAPTATVLGRRIDVLGASDVRAEAVIRGLTVAGAYVDELTLVAEPFFQQLLARMSVPGARLYATTNPDGPAHWVKRTVVDRRAALGYQVFHFRLEDNAWLVQHNPAYIAQLRREYTGLWYRRFLLGEWVQAEGAVFDMWEPSRHVIPHHALPPMLAVLALGVDYGTTNATRGELVGVGTGDDGHTRLYVLDEWAPPRSTDAELSRNLRGWLPGRDPEHRQPQWVYLDPAAASLRLQLFTDGLTNVVGASNQVLPGIRTVASLLATDRLQVSDRCRHLIDQLPGYSWNPKATEKGQDAPIKADDHEADALRYAVHSTRALWRTLIPTLPAADTAPGVDGADADLEGQTRAAA